MVDYSGNHLDLRVGGGDHPSHTLRIYSGGGNAIISFANKESAIAAADALAALFPTQRGLPYQSALECLKRANARRYMRVFREGWEADSYLSDPFDQVPRKSSSSKSSPLSAEDQAANDWCVSITPNRK